MIEINPTIVIFYTKQGLHHSHIGYPERFIHEYT